MEPTRIGSFQVLGTLGTGAHSTILHIRRRADNKAYALKVVPLESRDDQKFLEQARHEFRVAQMLDHPSLIKIYSLETPRDWLFRIRKAHLLIEYVNGKTLDTRPRIPVPQLVQIFSRVAGALVQMHRRGVCHADMKPNNILLSRAGDVKVIDFGLTWIRGEDKGRVQGTPEYMAPEQLRKSMVNELTDVYNFGATMYRLVTWRLPPNPVSSAQSGIALDAKAWDRLIKPVAECNAEAPPDLCQLIHQCLAYQPFKRPERMSDVHAVLEQLAQEATLSSGDRLEAMEW